MRGKEETDEHIKEQKKGYGAKDGGQGRSWGLSRKVGEKVWMGVGS